MKTIGTKSASELIFTAVFGALLLPLSFIFLTIALNQGFKYGVHFTFYLAILFFLVVLVTIIIEFIKPKDVIQYDNHHLVVNYITRQVIIRFENILLITAKRYRSKLFKSQFGTVIIRTKQGKFVAESINNCEDVVIELIRIKTEFDTRNSEATE